MSRSHRVPRYLSGELYLRWYRYTIAGHPREEWHLELVKVSAPRRDRRRYKSTPFWRDECEFVGMVKRYAHGGVWHACDQKFRRLSIAKRAAERAAVDKLTGRDGLDEMASECSAPTRGG